MVHRLVRHFTNTPKPSLLCVNLSTNLLNSNISTTKDETKELPKGVRDKMDQHKSAMDCETISKNLERMIGMGVFIRRWKKYKLTSSLHHMVSGL